MARNSKIYMAGAGGMLGEAFYDEFKDSYELKCTDKAPNEPWLDLLDFRDLDAYWKQVLDFSPDYLFHIGAHTDLEFCERNPSEAYSTNAMAVENAVSISNKLDIPLLYISTAGIFDGHKEVYDDWDVPNPICHYARSKYAGELFVRENSRRYVICRAGWMMGGGPKKDKKFIQKLMAQIKSGADKLHVVNDKLGTPTYTVDFARNTKLILEKEYWGLYNMVCDGVTGRFEVAAELLRLIDKEAEIDLEAVESEHFRAEYFAARPASERLICEKLKLRDSYLMRDWKVCLEEYVKTAYGGYL